MEANNLIRMINRIGEFFEAMPDREEAVEGIAQHIQKFWEPRMRLQILAALAQPDQAELIAPLVREALKHHAAQLGTVAV